MADTRKDKRAPISLKVRFKSATLDEFIEQYSVDISRGGIFIKSKTPMSIGTLLKFEFRLKDESRLIHGVGRVVWKREEDSSGKPPGMGIKFIKMDPESRTLVEQMVSARGDAPGRFEEGQESEAAPAAASFFPSTTPESELPAPEDRTQVRHASEFLASALTEGAAESASKEAEKKAEEARKRTEEIEKKRAEAKRKPRIKKTLVGVGVPDELDATQSEPPAIEAEPIASAAAPEPEKKAEARDVSESAETTALDRTVLDLDEPKAKEEAEEPKAAAKDEAEEAADEPKAEAKPEPDEKAEAKKPEPDKKAEAKEPEKKAEAKKPEPDKKAEAKKEPEKKAEAKPEKRSEPPKPRRVSEPPRAAEPQAAQEEPRSRTGMIVFGLVAAIALGVLAWTQLNPTTDPQTDTTQDIGSQPTDVDPFDDVVPDETGDELPTDEQGTDELAADDTAPDEEPAPVPTVAVQVVTTPAGATVSVGGTEQGAAPLEVQLPIGQATTVSAHLTGYTDASQEVTAAEGQSAIRLTLTQMGYAIHVETTPPGASVRGPGSATSPGDITLRRPPTGPVTLTASLRGYNSGTLVVQPTEFVEHEGRMVASVSITLEERARPAPREQTQAAHPPRGQHTAEETGAREQPAGGTSGEAASGETGSRTGRTGRHQAGSESGSTGGSAGSTGSTGSSGSGSTGSTGSSGSTGSGSTGSGSTGSGSTGSGSTGSGSTGSSGSAGGGDTGGGAAEPPPPDNPF